MSGRLMKTARRAAGWLLLAVSLWAGFGAADRLAKGYAAPSVRFAQPVPWREARRLWAGAGEGSAPQTAAEGETALPPALADPTIRPTFWQEEPGTVSGPWGETEAAAVWVLGDTALAWPVRCLTGGMPGPYDEAGCAVSAGLAEALFGSREVVGCTVEWQGQACPVRGVFAGAEPRLVAAARPGQSFAAAELAGLAELEKTPDTEQAALRWAAGAGLAVNAVVCGPGLAALGELLAFLPLAAALGRLALAAGRGLRRCPPPIPQLAGWGLAFAAAGGLPLLAARLPGWLRPGRWSDTAFWRAVLARLARQANELLALPPAGRDLLAKHCLLALLAAALAGLWLTAALAPRRAQGQPAATTSGRGPCPPGHPAEMAPLPPPEAAAEPPARQTQSRGRGCHP